MIIYILIFISKVIELSLSTLRLILVANGKKLLGSILQFIVAITWILVTGIVVSDIKSDPLKIVFFALGSLVGSLVGSIIEEKIGLGDILINYITENKNIENIIRKNGYKTITTKINDKYIILFIIKRKNKKNIIDLLKKLDKDSLIYSEKIKNFT